MTKVRLFICEKPSQARDIAKVMGCSQKGEGYLKSDREMVTWCFGHLLEAASPDFYRENLKPWKVEKLPIVPDKWKMLVKKENKKQVAVIKGLLKQTDEVIIATDADREGEVIARELLELFKYKGKIKRLWLSALDETSIKKALNNLQEGNATENLYYAGLGRQRADWLMGMNLTMATTVLHSQQGQGLLSVGRVQTPTLKLVVDRDHTIEHFQSKEYYEIEATFVTKDQKTFKAKCDLQEAYLDADNRLTNKAYAKQIVAKIQNQAAVVERYKEEHKSQSSPFCFSLSALQKIASSKFGFTAKETLDIAQSLYETHKAITYPRTDCQYLPQSQLSEGVVILNNLRNIFPLFKDLINQCDTQFKSAVWNDKKVTAHHGIIPSLSKNVKLAQLSHKELKIYEMICRYYIAQFLGDYEFNEVSVSLIVKEEIFKKTCQTALNPGWKNILQRADEDEVENENSSIPLLKKGEVLNISEAKYLTKNTTPPQRFTEGTLIDAMKHIAKYVEDDQYKKILKSTAGIGTEATRASIIETLFKRGYLDKKAKQVFATEKGKRLIALLPPIATNPALTAVLEQELDLIAEGKGDLDHFLDQQKRVLYEMLNELNPSQSNRLLSPSSNTSISAQSHLCPECTKPLIMRHLTKEKKSFWGCSAYPNCRFSTSNQNGAPLIKNQNTQKKQNKENVIAT